jgi:alanine dehydrogenase
VITREGVSVRVVDAVDIDRHIPLGVALEAARRAAIAAQFSDTEVRRFTLPMPGGWMRVMAGVIPSLGIFGYKEFHLSPGDVVRYAVHIFDVDTGAPLGIVDAALITTMRTAASAAAAAAAYYEGRTDPLTVGVIGSGAEARAGVLALSDALPVGKVRVVSRSEINRSRLADELAQALGIQVAAVRDQQEATAGSDVIYVATNSAGHVVVSASELGDVPFVASIGSTLPAQRELAADVFATSGLVIIDTTELLRESGDALAAEQAGGMSVPVRLLGEYLQRPVRPAGRTLYKSIGSPVQDLVLAAAILEVAGKADFGRLIEPLSMIKLNL